MTGRFLLKQFAGNAQDTGVFGSFQAGLKELSSDPEEIQKLEAWENGWGDAVSSGARLPRLEEMQGVQYVLCKALKELYSEGVPQWKAGETYYPYSVVSFTSGGILRLFYNKTGTHTDADPATDPANWELLDKVFTSKADLDSPDFSGIPTAPTAPAGTDTQQIATTSFVKTALAGETDGKVNISADNFSQEGKKTVAGFAVPNYAAGVDFSPGYTVPANGIIYVVGHFPYNGGIVSVAVNGVEAAAFSSAHCNGYLFGGTYVVGAGQVVTGTWASAKYFPYMGG